MSIRRTLRAQKTDFEKLLNRPEVESWRTLLSTYQKILRFLERELLKDNCSISRFQILLLIYFYGPLSATDMAQKLCVTRGNISTFLRRLELDQLIIILPAEGRGGRALVELTKKGGRMFEDIFPSHIKRVSRIMPRLSTRFMTTLREIPEI